MKSPASKILIALALLAALFLMYQFLRSDRHSGRTRGRRSSQTERSGRLPGNGAHGRGPGNDSAASCDSVGVSCATRYLADWKWPQDASCVLQTRSGYPVPDPRCTPGGVVPDLTVDTLRDPHWRTKCIRNCQSSEKQKHVTYTWYGLIAPADNNGKQQVCELDHLVPLELGGADGLGNIWPQCGPDEATLRNRYFKQKDAVENYLAGRVLSGDMPLEEAQRGIAADWTQYLASAAGGRNP